MLATAVNPTMVLLSGGRNSLLNREKFPVLREFGRAPRVFAAFCCISEAEWRNIKGLALIFFRFRARPRARARGTGATGGMQGDGGGRRARYAAIPPALAAGMISAKEREMARSSGTPGADKRTRPRSAMCASTSRMSAQRRTG